MNFRFIKKSGNRKTGPISIVSADSSTCWDGCPFRDCCYRNCGWLRKQAMDLDKSGKTLNQICNEINKLLNNSILRYGDIGDLPNRRGELHEKSCNKLVLVSKNKKCFSYTHLPPKRKNAKIIKQMNANGFCVNISAEGSGIRVDSAVALDIAPVVTILPGNMASNWRWIKTPNGNIIRRCPAEYTKIQCATCGGKKGPWCAQVKRDFVVGFTAHGFVNKINAAIKRVKNVPII